MPHTFCQDLGNVVMFKGALPAQQGQMIWQTETHSLQGVKNVLYFIVGAFLVTLS